MKIKRFFLLLLIFPMLLLVGCSGSNSGIDESKLTKLSSEEQTNFLSGYNKKIVNDETLEFSGKLQLNKGQANINFEISSLFAQNKNANISLSVKGTGSDASNIDAKYQLTRYENKNYFFGEVKQKNGEYKQKTLLLSDTLTETINETYSFNYFEEVDLVELSKDSTIEFLTNKKQKDIVYIKFTHKALNQQLGKGYSVSELSYAIIGVKKVDNKFIIESAVMQVQGELSKHKKGLNTTLKIEFKKTNKKVQDIPSGEKANYKTITTYTDIFDMIPFKDLFF